MSHPNTYQIATDSRVSALPSAAASTTLALAQGRLAGSGEESFMRWSLESAADLYGRLLSGSRVYVPHEGRGIVVCDDVNQTKIGREWVAGYVVRVARDSAEISCAPTQVFYLAQRDNRATIEEHS